MGVYVYRNDRVEGPFDELVLQQALMNGTMSCEESCCREGTEEWLSASTMFPVEKNFTPAKRSVTTPLSTRSSVPTLQMTWRWIYLFWIICAFSFLWFFNIFKDNGAYMLVMAQEKQDLGYIIDESKTLVGINQQTIDHMKDRVREIETRSQDVLGYRVVGVLFMSVVVLILVVVSLVRYFKYGYI